MASIETSDHERAARELQAKIYRDMPPRLRIAQALRMNAAMRRLLTTGLQSRHPEWTEPQIRRALAERILYARTG
ncbi:MAG: hypothetical protein NTU80_06335 [Verrucomicrobia bacterium]|nr:hypothetical protein [Verrucomicrobiota bacterium]